MPNSNNQRSLGYLLLQSCLLLLLVPNSNNHYWTAVTVVQADDEVDVFMEEPSEGMAMTNLTDDDAGLMMDDDSLIMMNDDSNNMTNGTEFPSEAPSMMPTEIPTLEGGVTESCLEETTAFTENPVLVQELESLLESYRTQFQTACPFSLSSSGCDLTFGSEGNVTYHDLCQEMGGQIYLHSVTLQCGVAPLDVKYDLGNVPQCIGDGCNVSKIENAGILRSSNISNFGSSLDNGACSASVESGASTSAFWVMGLLRSIVLVVGASTVLPTFLSAMIM